MTRPAAPETLRILSWNVNGLRSILAKGFREVIEKRNPDVVCLQEIKITADDLAPIAALLPGYTTFASHAARPGYSGVALLLRDNLAKDVRISDRLSTKTTSPLEEAAHQEGRVLIAESSQFLLYNIYFPSGTSGETRQDFKYQFLDHLTAHLNELSEAQRSRAVICGDFNICHKPEDIHHPEVATRRQLTGFLPDERAWIDRLVASGFVDSFRAIHPEVRDVYSWWTYRAGARGKNLGWRIDYQFVAKELAPHVEDAQILTDVMGSDHCPTELLLQIAKTTAAR